MTDCAQLLNDRDEAFCNGQDTSGFDQQLQACNLPRGTWNVDAYGTQGLLVIAALDTDGTVTGSILGNSFSSATWDSANRLLNFQRPLTGLPDNPQSYIGGLMPYVDPSTGKFQSTLAGTFQEQGISGTFGWFAQTSNPPDSIRPPAKCHKEKEKDTSGKEKDAMGKETDTMAAGGGNGGAVDLPMASHDQSSAQGRAFIRPEERPDIGRQVLQQPDQMQEENE